MYVGGSLALDAFDRASDVDVVFATRTDVANRFEALDGMHRELAREAVWCATELECIYMSLDGLRHFDRAYAAHLKLERGPGETLKLDTMDESWVVHCHVLRTKGITWDGPDPAALIDEVSRSDLQAAMRGVLGGWAIELLRHPDGLRGPGYQAYVVLSICRILYTLEEGSVVSKNAAAEWAITKLPFEWHGLISGAVADRIQDRVCAPDSAVRQTVRLIEYAQDSSDRAGR